MLAMMMVAMLSVGLVACGSDDDDSGNSLVVGTWVGQGAGEDSDEALTLVINGDNTGIWTSTHYDPYSGQGTESGAFTWVMTTANQGMVTATRKNKTKVWYFMINGNLLYIYDRGYGDSLEYILVKQ